MSTTGQQRGWRPSWPCPVGQILRQQRHGAGDPTFAVPDRHAANPTYWRGIGTPQGPATLRLRARPLDGEVECEAWGPGAEWALESVPAMLGADDDIAAFEARHPVVVEAQKHHPDWRIGRTGLVMEALVSAIIEQKVTGQEAFAGYRALVRRHGTNAPGPGPKLVPGTGLMIQPDAETLRTIPSWEWLRLHIDPARSRTIVTAARVAASLERCAALPADEADRRLQSLPGIGLWTSAETRVRALGDPDAVSFGDYHVAKDVGWALTGTPFDDGEMAAYLEPWRPQRGRVPAYLAMMGHHRPRHGPKMSPRTHLPKP